MKIEFDNMADPFDEGMELPPGHLIFDDETILRMCTRNEICVNLGVYQGRSSVLMAYYAKKVYAIDNLTSTECNFKRVEKMLKKYKNIKFMPMDSIQSAEQFENESIGMIFHDACHYKSGVIEEFNAWFPKVKKDGIFIFHDYPNMHFENGLNVKGAVKEIMRNNKVEDICESGLCKVLVKL